MSSPSTNSNSKKKFCAVSFVSEKQHGKPLSCCSNCMQTHYCSRTEQRYHWPAHKKTCGKITSEMIAFCDQMNFMNICFLLVEAVNDPTRNISEVCQNLGDLAHPKPNTAPKQGRMGTILVKLFERLQVLCTSNPDDFPAKMGFAYSELFRCWSQTQLSYEQARDLWACPGMVNFMIGCDMDDENLKVPDNWEEHRDIESVSMDWEKQEIHVGIGSTSEWNPGAAFFLVMSAFCRICVPHRIPRQLHRQDEYIGMKVMSWWANPKSRECIPMITSRVDGSSVRNHFFMGMLTTMIYFWQSSKPEYLAGFMSTSWVMRLVFEDRTFLTGMTLDELGDFVACLRNSANGDAKGPAWANFQPSQRLQVLEEFLLWKQSHEELAKNSEYLKYAYELADMVSGENATVLRQVHNYARSIMETGSVSKETIKYLDSRHKMMKFLSSNKITAGIM